MQSRYDRAVINAAKNSGTTIATARRVVESFVEEVSSLRVGDPMTIRNFGRFEKKRRKGRVFQNPRTGMLDEIPAREVITFRPAK